jgi:hypothetical protein
MSARVQLRDARQPERRDDVDAEFTLWLRPGEADRDGYRLRGQLPMINPAIRQFESDPPPTLPRTGEGPLVNRS